MDIKAGKSIFGSLDLWILKTNKLLKKYVTFSVATQLVRHTSYIRHKNMIILGLKMFTHFGRSLNLINLN